MLKEIFKEPLLHFLVIGALLFIIYNYVNDDIELSNNKISITENEIERLKALWNKKWQRDPTSAELQGLIEQQIREEVLYREALALGLDKNDSVVRRRMAQKLEFISADIAALAEPTDEELQKFLDSNPEKFIEPGEISFSHIYLSQDKRGNKAEEDAIELLSKLNDSESSMDASTVGDSFMLGYEFNRVTTNEVVRLFGNEFAETVFSLPLAKWQGPVQSGYGMHLVLVKQKLSSRESALEQIREKVLYEWQSSQRRSVDEAFYKSLREKYVISVAQ